MTAVPIYGDDGLVESALAVVRDITARKAAEQQLGQRALQQECVARLGEVALRERDLPTLLDLVVAAVARTLDLEFCEVLTLRGNDETLNFAASFGFPEGDRRDREVRPATLLLGLCLRCAGTGRGGGPQHRDPV